MKELKAYPTKISMDQCNQSQDYLHFDQDQIRSIFIK